MSVRDVGDMGIEAFVATERTCSAIAFESVRSPVSRR